MKRKTFISIFLIQFLVATTGLPLSITYCNIMKSEPVDDICPMCMMEREESSHCSLENINEIQNPIKVKSECCVVKSIDFSVKDKFLNTGKEDVNKIVVLSSLSNLTLNIVRTEPENGTTFFTSGKSPPKVDNNHIYKNISVFLI